MISSRNSTSTKVSLTLQLDIESEVSSNTHTMSSDQHSTYEFSQAWETVPPTAQKEKIITKSTSF